MIETSANTKPLNLELLTPLGPQTTCNSFLRLFSVSFVFDINYEKLQLKFFTTYCQFPGKFRDTDVPLVLNSNFS